MFEKQVDEKKRAEYLTDLQRWVDNAGITEGAQVTVLEKVDD